MKPLFSKILFTITLCYGVALAESPPRGLYFSPETNGHGLDLRKSGDNYIVVFYTYTEDSQPIWYLSVATEKENKISGNFSYVEYDASQVPPQQIINEPGYFTLDFNNTSMGTTCENTPDSDNKAVFDWVIDSEEGSWCVQLLLQADQFNEQNFGGLWYAGPGDTGWGLSLDFSGEGAVQTEVAVLFYYDDNGFPRWGLGSSTTGGPVSQLELSNFQGYCRTCPMVDLKSFPAGTINHRLKVKNGNVHGVIDLDVIYGLEPGGIWRRIESPLVPLSTTEPRLIPFPNEVKADKTILIKDTNVVPMTEGLPVLENRSVLIENGLIKAIDTVDQITLSADTVIIDGR